MTHIQKAFVFGFFTWLIPFLVSFLFYRCGQLVITESFFKSIMIVTGMLVGAVLLVRFFKTVTERFVLNGIVVGIIWLVINLGLDLLLVNRGFFPMTYQQYITDIGLRYLSIPIFSITLGFVLDHHRCQQPEEMKE